MAEINTARGQAGGSGSCSGGSSGFREAVCIDAARIYDSCSSRDCLEDLRVYFPDVAQSIVNTATNVKALCCEVLSVFIDVEPVPFNNGFYSIDLTYFFKIKVRVMECGTATSPTELCGLALFTKKTILYGSEGSVRVFSSSYPFSRSSNVPVCKAQVAPPVILDSHLSDCCDTSEDPISIPDEILRCFSDAFTCTSAERVVLVTLGVFTICQLQRSSQMLIPVYDFCVPEKECLPDSQSACDLFRTMEFPTDQFFPPSVNDNSGVD